jgi:hypothetical protein
MKLKFSQKMASLILLFLLSSLASASPTVGQVNSPAASVRVSPVQSVKKSPATAARRTTAVKGTPPIPTWLWFALGGLTVWNLLLSYLVWKNFENFDRKTYKNEKKLQDLESKDIALDHRIDRRNSDIDELARKVESYDAALSGFQSNSSSEPAFGLNAALESSTQTSDAEDSHSLDAEFDRIGDRHTSTSPVVTEPWDSIVQSYSYSPQALESYIIEKVSETEESLVSRRKNSHATVLLEHTPEANYWIFNGADQNSWLVPKSDLKLTPISYETFQALFECQDYQPNLKLQIVKPAKVMFNLFNNVWELEEKGQAQFAL